LQIRPQFLGFRGYCKKCGGRIALIGERNKLNAQRAQALPPREMPVPESQANVPVAPMEGFDSRLDEALDDIHAWDDEIAREIGMEHQTEVPPTKDQLARLRELGATEGQMSHLRTKADAVRLIEVLQPPPTEAQLNILRSLGVTEEELSFLTTEGVAQAMIEDYQAADDDDEEFESDY
jgi:hypothetical protein